MTDTQTRPWSEGTVAGLAVATFFVPLVGLIAGIVGLQNPGTKDQGGGLLAWGIVACIGWLSVMN